MGRPLHMAAQEQQRVIESLQHRVAKQDLVIDYIANLAGVGNQVTAIRRTADLENPGQPVPNPPSEPAAETTEQAATPEAYDNPLVPGQTPGSVQDLPADATGTPLDPGTTLPTSPFNELQEVTAPVAGTEVDAVPLEQRRTEVDVRVGDPMNPTQAFPWTMAGLQSRSMAAIHLARLQIQAGIADSDNDLSVAASIEGDRSISDGSIDQQIQTLSKVVKSASARSQRPPQAVPRTASVQRTTPSLVQQHPGLVSEGSAQFAGDTDAEDIFLT